MTPEGKKYKRDYGRAVKELMALHGGRATFRQLVAHAKKDKKLGRHKLWALAHFKQRMVFEAMSDSQKQKLRADKDKGYRFMLREWEQTKRELGLTRA